MGRRGGFSPVCTSMDVLRHGMEGWLVAHKGHLYLQLALVTASKQCSNRVDALTCACAGHVSTARGGDGEVHWYGWLVVGDSKVKHHLGGVTHTVAAGAVVGDRQARREALQGRRGQEHATQGTHTCLGTL